MLPTLVMLTVVASATPARFAASSVATASVEVSATEAVVERSVIVSVAAGSAQARVRVSDGANLAVLVFFVGSCLSDLAVAANIFVIDFILILLL